MKDNEYIRVSTLHQHVISQQLLEQEPGSIDIEVEKLKLRIQGYIGKYSSSD